MTTVTGQSLTVTLRTGEEVAALIKVTRRVHVPGVVESKNLECFKISERRESDFFG